jgi:hypothetical protein
MMAEEQKIKGPASYFPSIEKTYGHPVNHWFAILQAAGNLKHMELVHLLKTQHYLGHGHATALVAYYLKKELSAIKKTLPETLGEDGVHDQKNGRCRPVEVDVMRRLQVR